MADNSGSTTCVHGRPSGTGECQHAACWESGNWIRSERAKVLRWLAGELEGGRRQVVSWQADDTEEGELFTIEVRRVS